jgi:flagellar protein FliO/FliZ
MLCTVLIALFSTLCQANTVELAPANPVIALLKMLVALAIVLLVLVGFLKLLKRFQAPSLQAKSGLKLVSTYSLGQREKLMVMQVGDEHLLLGVTPTNITNLHVLPAPLELENESDTGNFKKTLSAAMSKEIPA